MSSSWSLCTKIRFKLENIISISHIVYINTFFIQEISYTKREKKIQISINSLENEKHKYFIYVISLSLQNYFLIFVSLSNCHFLQGRNKTPLFVYGRVLTENSQSLFSLCSSKYFLKKNRVSFSQCQGYLPKLINSYVFRFKHFVIYISRASFVSIYVNYTPYSCVCFLIRR